MLATVLALTLSGQGSWCENIRAVRRLAQRDALDDTSLAVLEQRYCVAMPDHGAVPPQPSAPAAERPEAPVAEVHADCASLWTLAVLARASRASAPMLQVIDAQVRVSCSPGAGDLNALQWSGGAWAKSGETWWYPNGRAARQRQVWWYPSGRVARNGPVLYFPNGKVAKSGSTWFDPDTGKPTTVENLLTWFCSERVAQCNPRLAAMKGLPEEAREAGYLELLTSGR